MVVSSRNMFSQNSDSAIDNELDSSNLLEIFGLKIILVLRFNWFSFLK